MYTNINTGDSIQDLQLTEVQLRGMQNYSLTPEDVQTINFSEATLAGMDTLLQQERVNTYQEAFATVRGLNATQIQAVIHYDMNREQVLDSAFGEHTLNGIDKLVRQQRAESIIEATGMLRGLNPYQVEGVVTYSLDPHEVQALNYGEHTNTAIRNLRSFRRVRNFRRALQLVRDLDPNQTRGVVDFQLSREQVLTPNFGVHTLTGMQNLMESNRVSTYREGFTILRELNPTQVAGVTVHGLRKKQVLDSNFGKHTLSGIMALRRKSQYALSSEEAYRQIQSLNRIQTEGVVRFGLTAVQITDPLFDEHFLNTMNALNLLNPNATGQTIYNYVQNMPEYQIRAIGTINISPEQLGIAAHRNDFRQLETSDREILSGSTVDTIAHLLETSTDIDDALDAANNLDIYQKIAMLEMGLTLEQVQSPFFEDSENALHFVMQELKGSDEEFELPLLDEDQQRVQEIIENLILQYELTFNDSQNVEGLNTNEVIRAETGTGLLEPEGYRLDDNDVDEFLKYALPRDFLGIFDGLDILITKHKEESLPEKKNDVEETDSVMMQEAMAIFGVASRPSVGERSESFESIDTFSGLGAFTVPSKPGNAKMAGLKDTDSSDSEEDRKLKAKKTDDERKPSPRSKNKSYKR